MPVLLQFLKGRRSETRRPLALAAVALVDRRQLREVALHARRELVALVELLLVGPQKLQLGLAPVSLTASPCFETEVPCETRPLGADDGEDRAREERDRQPAHGINSLPTPFASKEGLPTTRYVDSCRIPRSRFPTSSSG